MLTIGLAALIVFVLAFAGLSVGVIFRRRQLAGSCGALAGLRTRGGAVDCFACEDPSPECQGLDWAREHGASVSAGRRLVPLRRRSAARRQRSGTR